MKCHTSLPIRFFPKVRVLYIWFVAIFAVIMFAMLYQAFNPVVTSLFNYVQSQGAAYGSDDMGMNFLNTLWVRMSVIFLIGLVIWVSVKSQKRDEPYD